MQSIFNLRTFIEVQAYIKILKNLRNDLFFNFECKVAYSSNIYFDNPQNVHEKLKSILKQKRQI